MKTLTKFEKEEIKTIKYEQLSFIQEDIKKLNTEEKNKLAEENLGLVYLVVNKEFTYEKTTESDRENYIEEGMIGLAKAINTFNPSKGAKFSTYAYTCIKFEINNYVRKKNNHKRKINYACKNSIDEYIKGDEGGKILTHKNILMDTKDAYSSISKQR